MGQGEQSSSFLLALDFGKEIHSVLNEVMLDQNFTLAKSLCLYFFPFSIFCLFGFVFFCLWVVFLFFLLLHCLALFLLCTVLFPLSGKRLATQQILVWHLCPLLSLLPSPYRNASSSLIQQLKNRHSHHFRAFFC